ncbi:MAG: SUF system NifU family Fe-S cluster assembly protein [Planctomycetes bacterium]|nr:SUF system NifU family Fe-S cluster assembly protein [Planctomycetota bacterium]
MDDLRDLYQEVILDHGKHPRNFRKAPAANRTAHGYNPLCGDQVEIFLELDEGGVVKDICFQGSGCAISTASTSMMTQALKGKTLAQARALFEEFHALITGTGEPDPEKLGKLAVFSGVREFPNRAKCATLAWHTMCAALENRAEPVSTE